MPEKLTLGLFISTTHDKYESEILRGVHDSVREAGANVICFTSGVLRSYHGFPDRKNLLYDLAGVQNVDGIIVSGTLAHATGTQEIARFCARYSPLPMVSIAFTLPDIPHVMVDSASGIQQTVEHLIETHQLRRLAFLRGPQGQQEAEDRFQSFQKTMAAHKLKVLSTLILDGDYSYDSGKEAMRKLLKRGNVRFDGLVSANDSMAMGAIEALTEAGLRVPQDVAVVGFDDTPDGRALAVPLTTVRQLAYEEGQEAVQLLLQRIRGQEHPAPVMSPASIVVRRSCGCVDFQPGVTPAWARAGEDGHALLLANSEKICADVCASLAYIPARQMQGYAKNWLDAFLTDLDDFQANNMLEVFEQTLWQAVPLGIEMVGWNRALRVFRIHALACLHFSTLRNRALAILDAVVRRAGECAEQIQEQLKARVEQEAFILRDLAEVMMTSPDLPLLLDIMAAELPHIGARVCFLSIFEDPAQPAQSSRLILAYDAQGRIELPAGGVVFPSTELAPAEFRSRLKSANLVVEALYSKENCLGFVLLDISNASAYVSGSLRGLLSNALSGVLLFQQRKTLEMERHSGKK